MLSEMLGLIFLVCFAASVVGAVCGIGGGVIMKPVLDTFGFASVSTISFLSGCTVLAMSAYSIGKTVLAGESEIEYRTATPLAIGAAAGGVIGKQLFTLVKNSSPTRFCRNGSVGGTGRCDARGAALYRQSGADPSPSAGRSGPGSRNRDNIGNPVQLSRDWRRADQPAGAPLLFFDGNQDGGAEFALYHPFFAGGEPRGNAGHRDGARSFSFLGWLSWWRGECSAAWAAGC